LLQKLFFRLPASLQSGILLLRSALSRHISAHAAGISFFMLLALFPMAILSCRVLGMIGFHPENLLAVLLPLVPTAFTGIITQLTEGFFAERSFGALSFTALLALWSASRGIYGLMRGLNAICGLEDNRSFLRRRLICIAYLAAMVLALPTALIAHMIGYTVLARIGVLLPLVQQLGSFLILGTLFSGVFAFFLAMRLRLKACMMGGFLAASLWQLFTALFSVYCLRANSYSTLYGSLRFCALGLLWLYFCMMILLFCGLISTEIHRRLAEPS